MNRTDDMYSDFPNLEEIKRDYTELMEIIKDVRTIEQAREIENKEKLTVEINGLSIDEYVDGMRLIDGTRIKYRGTDKDIEWIRYEAYGCLAYIYDRFNGKPMFDVWCNVGDCEFITDITIDDLTEENYQEWVANEKERISQWS